LNYHLDLTWEVPLGRRSPISSRHLGTFYVLTHIMLWEDGKPRTRACKPRTRINEKRSSQKGAHLGRFCQGILRANMITQLQNSRRLACLRNPRILIHSWKGQGLAMKTTRHVTEERKESLSLSGWRKGTDKTFITSIFNNLHSLSWLH